MLIRTIAYGTGLRAMCATSLLPLRLGGGRDGVANIQFGEPLIGCSPLLLTSAPRPILSPVTYRFHCLAQRQNAQIIKSNYTLSNIS